ncbi:tetratricopeptide repeat protein [Bradyrhizobium sp.]|uniref:tetratricopeptide repeat protein n=1 Tax=Bradyrhizobium sp. TaxID=376 RepID=UPI001ED5A287|nr:tetratricopeptide repeat protein [Bradyrhizobium sp.]MBV9985355.1 tetratricopeptide repeat protein [Bradyrhizobium sp.]
MNRKLRRAAAAAAKRTGGSPADPRAAGLFSAGLKHHQCGRLAQAEAHYRETLALQPDHADALHLLGVIASQVGRHDVAVDLIGRAIARDRMSALYHSNHGLALAGLKRFADAIESYDRALSLRPDDAELRYNRGNALLALGRPCEALEAYERALLTKPDHVEALCNRGAALAALGQSDEALSSYDRALAVAPHFSEALANRGNALKALGRLDDALSSYERALTARPGDAQALFNRGVTLHELKRFEEALASYDDALAASPDHSEALSNRGDALKELGRLQEALASYDRALAVRPDYAEALSNRGNLLKLLRRFDDALASYDAALRLRPDYPEALSNRAVTLQALDRIDEALASCDRALALASDSVAALINRASVLQELRRFDEALSTYDRVAAIAPDHAEAQINRALLLLLSGDFGQGWPAYEWRRKLPSWAERGFSQGEWTGEDIVGQRLLLHAEQGFGDTIQFARFAALAAARGIDVVLEVQPALAPLLGGLFGLQVIAAGRDPLPPFDRHCPLLSLPRVFATTLASIPSGVPYIIAPADRIAAWAPRLPGDGLRVGLAWSGHPDNVRDHERSIPFARLAPLTAIPGARFVSLQKDIRATDADDARRCGNVIDLGGGLRDFADTAAIVAQLDLVITVDTAVAHLAGAMGKPVWVLLPRVPDFRWLLDRATSPWYPSARLFRKGQTDTWDDVIAGVAKELAARAASASGTREQPDPM